MAFNRELNENTVRYVLYDSNDGSVSLNDCISKYYSDLAHFISSHIWHNQSFNLKVKTDSSGISHLEGITNFGDNIDDEWLIVFLLYQLSRLNNNLVIKVDDSDGEFLLIEAANHLPKWCEPSNCQNRVFIYREAIHIIPLKYKPFENTIPLISEAIDLIRRNPEITRCNEDINKSIVKRIQCFPQRIKEYQHKSHCFVPIGVAALLKQNPSLISLAVNSFYNRTPDELKVCQAMRYFPPESRVMRCITFTRCLYAQLMSQSYTPDIKVGWNIPPKNSKDFKSHDLGMKIASGFEILISNSNSLFNENSNQIDFTSDRRWIAFHKSLVKNEYFGQELVGSKKYTEVLKTAQNYFSDLIINNEIPEDYDLNQTKGSQIHKILKTLEIDDKEFENEAKNLENEDSDEWLSINSDELDSLLSEKFCSNIKTNNLSDISNQIPETIKAFVMNQSSGLKGAEAPIPLRPNRVNFDENTFSDALKSVLSLKVPQSDTDSSSSGMSDYSDDEDSIDSDDDCYQQDLNGSQLNPNKEKMEEMKAYMKAMDQQLSETAIGQSFEKKMVSNSQSDVQNEQLKGVDIDLNALTNILESYGSECGVPGPATALFATMGVKLPDNTEED